MPLPLLCPQNLLRVGSALLDAGNKRHWELIQQTEGGTAQLLRHFEEYARALARNMPQTYLSPFTIVTPNIGQWGHAWLEGCERGISLGTWACWGHVCAWGHACALGVVPGTWAWVCLGTCVCSGDVCVLGTWTCVWKQTRIYLEYVCAWGCVCTRTYVCWEHVCMCDVCTWERVLGTWTFVCLGNVSCGTWVCLEGQWVLGPWPQAWWMLGSVGAGIHVPKRW